MRVLRNRYGEVRSGISIVAMFILWIAVTLLTNVVANILLGPGGVEQASDLVFSIVNLVMLAAQTVVIVLAFKIIYRRDWREMGFTRRGAVAHSALGLVFGVVSIAVVAGILVLTGHARVTDADPARMLSLPFWMGLLQFILVGVHEETLCRGYMMTALKTTRVKYVVMLTPALLFALLHLGNSNVTVFSLANIMLVGVLFAYLMVKTGNIWAAIGYHISWNFVQGDVLGIAVSGGGSGGGVVNIAFTGADWFTGGAFGAEGGAACTLALVLGLLFIRFCVKTPAEPAWTLDNNLPMVR